MSKTIVVTGGAGFIGSNFINYLLLQQPDVRVICIDKLTYAGVSLPDNYKRISKDWILMQAVQNEKYLFLEEDICEYANILAVFIKLRTLGIHIDYIVNFAAESHVDKAITNSSKFVNTNILGTISLLNICKYFKDNYSKTIHFHQVSTDEVYGDLPLGEGYFNELSPYKPNNPYAASKASADHFVRAFGHTHGLSYTISNCSNNFGPYQHPEKFLPKAIISILAGNPIPVYGDGKNERHWIYVWDHCNAIKYILEDGVVGRTYIIAPEEPPISNIELIYKIADAIKIVSNPSYYPKAEINGQDKYRPIISYVANRPGHDRRYALSSKQLEYDTNFKISFDQSAALRETVAFYMFNKKWWEKLAT